MTSGRGSDRHGLSDKDNPDRDKPCQNAILNTEIDWTSDSHFSHARSYRANMHNSKHKRLLPRCLCRPRRRCMRRLFRSKPTFITPPQSCIMTHMNTCILSADGMVAACSGVSETKPFSTHLPKIECVIARLRGPGNLEFDETNPKIRGMRRICGMSRLLRLRKISGS